MDSKELIKQKLNIVDIIGEYLTLKKAGSSYKGLCPFHGEKTPSFHVSEDRQRFHCFGCNEDGDVFTFIQKIENFDFPEALEFLANKAGVPLEKAEYGKRSEKRGLAEINELAAKFYHQVLVATPHGKKALEYLTGRGVTMETIQAWGIGYAPDAWDSLIKALKGKGISEQMMVSLGLVVQKEGGKVYDRFRKRIIFPIRDMRGQTVGFTSRVIDKADEQFGGKYVNTPQTALYNKSEVLFGLDKAKETIKKTGFAVMVEGNMDVIMSHQAGVSNVIATSGTAMTADHLKTLKRYTQKISFCFDADSAGEQALLRAFHVANQNEFEPYIIVLPRMIEGKEVKDPDDAARIAPAVWQKVTQEAIPAMEFYFQNLSSKYNLGSPEGLEDGKKFIFSLLVDIKSNSLLDYWFGKLSQRLSVNELSLREDFKRFIAHLKKPLEDQQKKSPVVAPRKQSAEHRPTLAEHLLSMLLLWPEFIDSVRERLSGIPLWNDEVGELYKRLFLYYNHDKEFEYSQFFKYLEAEPELAKKASTLSFAHSEQNDAIPPEKRHLEVERAVSTIEYLFYKQELSRLQMELASAEASGDGEKVSSLMSQITHYHHLLNQHHHGSN